MILFNRKVLILTFCSIGCSVHLLYVINEFLKFSVLTDIIYEYPKKIVVPEIDIFLYNIDFLNITELYHEHSARISSICQYFSQLSNSTINSKAKFDTECVKLLKSYRERSYLLGTLLTVGDVEKLNAETLIYRSKTNEFIRNDLCSVKKYFNAINTFLRISCRNDSKPIEMKFMRNIVVNNRFCIKHNIYHSFGVRFSHPNTLINPEINEYVKVEREEGENVYTHLRFREINSENSEWPHQTNCRHYQKAKIFKQCLREKVAHFYPGTVQIDDVLEVGQLPSNFKFQELRMRENETLSQSIDECSEKIEQLQCIEKSIITRGSTSKEKGSGIGIICLENQVDFNIILKTYPESTFTELLIYISSILGIWFGISIYGKLIDGFVFTTKTAEPTTREVEPGVDIATMTEEHETV